MAWVLVAAFCLLSGAYAQQWGVTLAPGPVERWAGSCVTIPCSFTYPAGWTVRAVIWTRDGDPIMYRWDEARVQADFKARVRYLGDLQHNCSLRVAGLRPSDRGTYRFRFEVVTNGSSRNAWTGQPGQQLNVSAHPCQPSLGHRTKPGRSLTCSVWATCPHRPSWYDRDGARWSPGQTPGRARPTELRISPSELDPGAALRCQVDGYRDECDSDQSQPLGTVAPNVPRVEVPWPAGKAALREGDNFTLRCRAAALWPFARYVWSRGDVWLPEAGQDLRVDKAAVSDGGSYACGVWVSGPGWGYLSLSARESVQVQRAYAQEWKVTLAPGPLDGWVGSCMTIPCSFTYPAGWNIKAVSWTRDWDQIMYHSDEARFHADFEEHDRYLGDLQYNCSLRVAGLRPSDQGTYRFWFYTAAHRCQPSLGRQTEPGPSLNCSVGTACPHRPSWYDRDGTWRSPGQTPGGAESNELRISPSQLDPSAALRCQVDGYRDECDSAQSQPLGTVTPNVPRVEVLWPTGKAALREGDGFTLRCQAAALRPIAGYVWSRGDVWLPEAGQDLRVRKAAVSDGGSYACGVWVSGPGWGYLSFSARESVEVQHAPTGVRVTAAPGTSLQEGESVTLMCSYNSSLPAPTSYTWYRGDRQLGGSQQEMVLKSITVEQAGEYHCQAANGIGQSWSPPINITVGFTPSVRAPAYIIGPTVALVLLLLVGLVGVTAWSKMRRKRQGMSSNAHQPGPGETPMSERIYENAQHSGMGQPARLAPPGPPSATTELRRGSPDGTEQSHIYSQPMNRGKVPQGDPDEVQYSAIQLQPPTQRAEPAADLTCEYAAIKR
ncbi:B-cell receptor CD22-like [Mauremys reevesii]|uniref:B-cell receptor CD22-like n=1 Tax=Mauremys reevesii TaxID=260615 RepID=UPI0019400041|nr:B-cell receptor CD22-like [Mauremys reevesii]